MFVKPGTNEWDAALGKFADEIRAAALENVAQLVDNWFGGERADCVVADCVDAIRAGAQYKGEGK